MLLGSITGGEIYENLKPLCLKILIQYHVKRLKKVTTKHGWGRGAQGTCTRWKATGAEPHRQCTSPTRALANNLALHSHPKRGRLK